MLSKTAFDDIINQIEFKLDIDLFASRINKKIPKFVSFKTDPQSITVNTFNMDWRKKILKFFHHSFVYHVYCKRMEAQSLWHGDCARWPNQIW